jgi:PAS domain-containing protein
LGFPVAGGGGDEDTANRPTQRGIRIVHRHNGDERRHRETAFALPFILFIRGWKPSLHLFAAAATILTGFAFGADIFVKSYPMGIIIPILMAAMLSNWIGILGSGTGLIIILILRHGSEAILSAPSSALVYVFCVVSIALLWAMFDQARRDAEKRADEQEASTEHLRFQSLLLDSVGQAVVAGTMDDRITFMNRAAVRMK